MSFQPPITISEAIKKIDDRTYLLPSIQREYTWWENQIRWLFDSLMQGYPINSLLLWEVNGSTKRNFKFYEILKDYVEYYKPHNDEFNINGHKDFFGILDGQQRLGSLYIGLKGSFAWHKYYASWQYSKDNFPPRKLYINLKEKVDEQNEEGLEYDFQFLTDSEYEKDEQKWFLVGDILEIDDSEKLLDLIQNNTKFQSKFARKIVSRLSDAVHKDTPINCYIEKSQDIDKALNIFIRINKNGTPLDFSDLVMSIVTAHWKSDARDLIYGLVDEVFRNYYFSISKDFILKTYLYLFSEDTRFKVNNFTIDKAREFEDNWKTIRKSILTVFKLASKYGFTEQTLTSKNAILPIIYHLHHNKYSGTFDTAIKFKAERKLIKKWLHLVLLKQIFGASADTVLRSIRKELKGKSNFPANKIVAKFSGTNKDMSLDEDFIENTLKTQKDHNRAFSILAILYPNLDYENGDFHKDHLHPAICFQDDYLSNSGIPENDLGFYKDSENWNSILNLQLLNANENMSKNAGELEPWVNREVEYSGITKKQFCKQHLLPDKLAFKQFKQFIEERKIILSEELKKQTSF
jgi:uncharacterized protein with ParB-like and HNH nuclease domain